MHNTVISIASPGKVTVHQASKKKSLESPSILPQVITSGSVSPKKLKAASYIMDIPILSVIAIIRGGKALGKTTLKINRLFHAPTARAAITYSRSLIFRNSARVRRASVVHDVTPIAKITTIKLEEKTATITMAKTKGGST